MAVSHRTSRHNTANLNNFSNHTAAMLLHYVLSAQVVLAVSLFNTRFLAMIQCKTVIQVTIDKLKDTLFKAFN